MALTTAQLGLCFQTYWYMWLTNGLSGLILLGIQIGIAAFFLKKFGNKNKSSKNQPSVNRVASTRRVVSPSDMNAFEEPPSARANEYTVYENSKARNISAESKRIPGAVEDNDEFAQSALYVLNGSRRRHNSSALELNDQLSEIAQRWAEQMARSGKLEHSPVEWRNFGGQTLGENYSASFQTELTGEKMVRKWMKEGKRYMFGFDGRKDSENFTQLVWRSSQEVGVGRARSEDGNWWYGVVVFNPPGNLPNQYAQNVLLPAE